VVVFVLLVFYSIISNCRFICSTCFDAAERKAKGFASEKERLEFLAECKIHTEEHRVCLLRLTNPSIRYVLQTARAHMEANARLAQNDPHRFGMILLDGTPGPTWPSWAKSAKPDIMRGKFCIPLFWEIGKSYANDQWYYLISLHWWPKGANILFEIKYRLLRSLFTSGLYTKRTTLFDQFDGGSENRNYGNLVLSSEVFNEVATNFHTDMLGDDDVPDRVDDEDTGIAGFEGSRITAHCHNEGDAKITAPRKA